MKRFLFLFLLGAFFCACTSDDGEQVIFVTDIEMPPGTEVFAPGDEVTVKARGFEADDDIMFRITWPLSQTAVSDAYADGVWAVVTGRTETSITFLAPGGYPAATTEVKLFRRGKVMPLGKIAVSDGLPPEGYSLYGIREYIMEDTDIDRIDMVTGEATPIAKLGVGKEVRCAVNDPGTNRIYCVTFDENYGAAAFYDLTMRYYRHSGVGGVVTAGVLTDQNVAFFRYEDERFLMMNLGSMTRSTSAAPVSWLLPEGIKPEMLSENPFVMVTAGYFLLSAHNADGDYLPVVLDAHSGDRIAVAGEAEQADAMVPFRVFEPQKGESTYAMVGGYAVAKEGVTELRLFDPKTLKYEVMAEIPATVRSVAVHFAADARQSIYMLCDADESGKRIIVYDMQAKTQSELPGTVACSRIVLAK